MLDALRESKQLRSGLSAFIAFVGYGGWAYIANISHGADMATRSALVQGSYSFTITLILSLLIEYLFSFGAKKLSQVFLTCFLTCLMLYVSSWGINYIARTPNIIMTILPGAIIGTVYTIAYCLTLYRLQRV